MPKIPNNLILNFFVAASALIIAPLCTVDGIFFGPISLINGLRAIQQIKHNSSDETGYRLAIIGMALGIMGMIINILIWYVYIRAITSD